MKKTKVYADSYQATIQIFNRTKTFPRALRPTLGRKIEEASINCLLSLRKAEVAKKENRMNHLISASESIDEIRTLIQLSRDLRAINIAGFSELSGLTKEIGKEIGGFIKFERKFTR